MNILITGAGGSIGSSIVTTLAKDTTHQIIGVGRSAVTLDVLADTIKFMHPDAHLTTRVFDLSSSDTEFEKFIQILSEEIDHIDILINNAGAFINKPFQQTENKDWDMLFKTNVFGPAKLIRACLPLLTRSPQAHIINIGSMGGFTGSQKFSGLTAYSASKAALSCLTEVLACELPKSIHTNCLCFGSVDTQMFQDAFPNGSASMSATDAGSFIANFALNNWKLFNGKIIPIASTTP